MVVVDDGGGGRFVGSVISVYRELRLRVEGGWGGKGVVERCVGA